jgi:hypothetical protein
MSLLAGDCHFRKVCLSGILLIFFLLLAFPAQAYEWGTWTENVAEAKTMALMYNRPILAIFGSPICVHCDNLEDKVLHQPAFLDYAVAQRLVLFHCRNDGALQSVVYNTYKNTCGIAPLLPHIYLFKVKPEADLESTARTALNPDQVSLLEISAGPYAGKLSGTNYANVDSINGIKLEHASNWSVDTFIRVLESFFPNKLYPSSEPGWDSVVPEPDGPPGYEGALDLGRMPNSAVATHPANGKDWIFTLAGRLSGDSPERWYKFTGDESSRFILSATRMDGSMKFEFFRSDGTRPLYPTITTVDPITWDALDRGVWLDSPGGSNPLYFLRLSHLGGG